MDGGRADLAVGGEVVAGDGPAAERAGDVEPAGIGAVAGAHDDEVVAGAGDDGVVF